jgi:NAD(P)-dependent dehydrogenase (short-subunit alcohol dehydrogenase family)
MARLDGKVAVIVGGNSGIGLASAKAFVREGANVVIAGRDQTTLNQASRELGAGVVVVRADVSKLSNLDNLFNAIQERFGRIDVLFANAGIAHFVPVEESRRRSSIPSSTWMAAALSCNWTITLQQSEN